MKMEYLDYLIMLKQAGSINKSAALLHTSPQNVSRVLKQIEDEWGAELFKRLTYGVEFTEAGEKAIELAVDFTGRVADFKRVYGRTAAEAKYSGEINIIATKIQNNAFCNTIVLKFTKQYPEIKVNLLENDFFSCLHELKAHENALGILPLISDKNFSIVPPEYRQKYRWEIINEDRITILANSKSIFNRQKSVSYAALRESPFVIYARNNFADGFWSQIIAHYISSVHPVFIASNSYMFFNKIIEDGYIGLGCRDASRKSDSMQVERIKQNIRFIPIQSNDIFYNCLVYDEEVVRTPEMQCFISFFKKELQNGYLTNQDEG